MKVLRKLILFLLLAQSALVLAAGQPFTQSQFANLMKEGNHCESGYSVRSG